MKNETRREFLRILANAPAVALSAYVATLKGEERAEAIRLAQALKIPIKTE